MRIKFATIGESTTTTAWQPSSRLPPRRVQEYESGTHTDVAVEYFSSQRTKKSASGAIYIYVVSDPHYITFFCFLSIGTFTDY